nr:DUF349 domain-containing protein [Algoriphagus sp.]
MTEKSNDLSDKDKVTSASESPEAKGKEKKVENSSEKESSDVESKEAAPESSAEEKTSEPEVVEAKEEDAAVTSELDETDEEEEEDHHDEDLDIENLSKAELVKLLKEKTKESSSPLKLEKMVNTIKAAFDEYTHKERDEALEKFKAEGGTEDDFDFRPSDEERDFNTYYYEFKKQVSSIRKEAEKQKEKNLDAKTEILNKLRELVDGEETTLSINAIKSIQEEWKSIGPVPAAQNRSLWASYNALMDRFYDNRSIYFELKELDRKKNLESKLELCEKAEALKDMP